MSTKSFFQQCITANNDGNQPLIQLDCIADFIESNNKTNAMDRKQWLLILTGSLVFFMQAGFAMVCAGAVRKKNLNSTMLKNLLDACGAAVAFAATGFALAFGGNNTGESSFVGSENFFLTGDINASLFFFQFAFSATAATIVAGTLAERCRMAAYVLYSMLLSGFVYPVVAHAIWNKNGYFSAFNSNAIVGSGMLDFSGSGVIHLTGGLTALYATMVVGPRRGRFYDSNGIPRETPGLQKGHSIALQLLGTLILWFGWYGFNTGSSLMLGLDHDSHFAALAAVNTTLAAASGAIAALVTNAFLIWRKAGEFHMDLVVAMNGLLAGLVANTAGCGFMEPWAAALTGMFAGWIYLVSSWALIRLKIDDAVDAIPVHLTNGLWGVLAVGFLASPDYVREAFGEDTHVGLFYTPDDATLLLAQLVGVLFIFAWTLVTMFPFFWVLNFIGWLRVNELEEIVGLDATYRDDKGFEQVFGSEDSHDDEEERKEAFVLRCKERAKKSSTLSEVAAGSWGEIDVSVSVKGSAKPGQTQQTVTTDESISQGGKSLISPRGMDIDICKSE